jgi:hypothetical protein
VGGVNILRILVGLSIFFCLLTSSVLASVTITQAAPVNTLSQVSLGSINNPVLRITVSGNVATITIGAGETSGLAAAHHELQATDTAGNVSTLMTGTVTFTPTEIAP